MEEEEITQDDRVSHVVEHEYVMYVSSLSHQETGVHSVCPDICEVRQQINSGSIMHIILGNGHLVCPQAVSKSISELRPLCDSLNTGPGLT